jgi:hypothetical protein
MPVDGCVHITVVHCVDRYLGSLIHVEGGPRNRAVVREHSDLGIAELLLDRSNAKVEMVAIFEMDIAGAGRLRQSCRLD